MEDNLSDGVDFKIKISIKKESSYLLNTSAMSTEDCVGQWR